MFGSREPFPNSHGAVTPTMALYTVEAKRRRLLSKRRFKADSPGAGWRCTQIRLRLFIVRMQIERARTRRRSLTSSDTSSDREALKHVKRTFSSRAFHQR